MAWFSGFMSGALFVAAAVMFAYNAWRLASSREARLLRLSQVVFWAAFMLIAIPKEPTDLDSDWPFWTAFVLLLASLGLTIAHKRRRKLPLTDAGAESDGP